MKESWAPANRNAEEIAVRVMTLGLRRRVILSSQSGAFWLAIKSNSEYIGKPHPQSDPPPAFVTIHKKQAGACRYTLKEHRRMRRAADPSVPEDANTTPGRTGAKSP